MLPRRTRSSQGQYPGLDFSQDTDENIKIQVSPVERWGYIGKTGSGKSTLARYNLRLIAQQSWPILIIDSPDHLWMGEQKKEGDGFAKRGNGTVDAPRLITRPSIPKDVGVYCYQPKTPGYDDLTLLQLIEQALKRHNILVYFDELYGIVTANNIPDAFQRLWAQGRKINVGAWASTQRPARIPEIVLSQAENYAIFRITNIEDRKKLAGYVGSPIIKEVMLPRRYFFYMNEDMDYPKLMKPIAIKSGQGAPTVNKDSSDSDEDEE